MIGLVARFKLMIEYAGTLADQGQPEAQYVMGDLAQRGLGMPQDYAAAARWFRGAAERGLPAAQFNLGMLHRYGTGVPMDLVEAYAWLSLAAEGGHPEAAGARDLTAQRMTGSQVVTAQGLATERRQRAGLAARPPQPGQFGPPAGSPGDTP